MGAAHLWLKHWAQAGLELPCVFPRPSVHDYVLSENMRRPHAASPSSGPWSSPSSSAGASWFFNIITMALWFSSKDSTHTYNVKALQWQWQWQWHCDDNNNIMIIVHTNHSRMRRTTLLRNGPQLRSEPFEYFIVGKKHTTKLTRPSKTTRLRLGLTCSFNN